MTSIIGKGNGKVNLNGVIVEPGEARISIFDRGFLYGDSVFETLRVYDACPFEVEAHLDRFYASGVRIGFALPWSYGQISQAIAETLRAAALPNAYLRLIATRGAGTMGLDPRLATDPQLLVVVLELPPLPAAMYERGRRAALVSVIRPSTGSVDPLAKTGNYLNSVLASAEGTRRGADEAIMLASDGRVAEASAANVFALIDGTWQTPPLDVGILSGITRKTILRLTAAHGIACDERELWPADLLRASEIFLCASVREIVPIVELDGVPVGNGLVGAATRSLRSLYAGEVVAYVARTKAAAAAAAAAGSPGAALTES